MAALLTLNEVKEAVARSAIGSGADAKANQLVLMPPPATAMVTVFRFTDQDQDTNHRCHWRAYPRNSWTQS